jgi:RimJ/RimL family protein N-acetyltransferase
MEVVVDVGNTASQRVAEKAGAKREGVQRNRLWYGDHPGDGVMYALTPGDLA